MAFLESSFESENSLNGKGTVFKLQECRGWASGSALMPTTGAEYEEDRSAMARMACRREIGGLDALRLLLVRFTAKFFLQFL
jgi:hypothetical protein